MYAQTSQKANKISNQHDVAFEVTLSVPTFHSLPPRSIATRTPPVIVLGKAMSDRFVGKRQIRDVLHRLTC